MQIFIELCICHIPSLQFVNYAHHAIAFALWVGPESIQRFIAFVDTIMSKQDDDFMSVAKVTAKDVAQQVCLWVCGCVGVCMHVCVQAFVSFSLTVLNVRCTSALS